MKFSRVLAGMALPMTVAGCASFPGTTNYLDELQATTPSGPAFTQALSKEYAAFADADRQQYDWINSWYFARKGLEASRGVAVPPEDPADWKIRDAQAAGSLAQARTRLTAVLNSNAPSRAPTLTATAQVKYDCWVEKQDYTWREGDIAACRTDFLAAMDALEKQAGVSAPSAAQPAAPAVAVPAGDRFQLFFDFNKDSLAAASDQTIRAVAQAAKAAGYPALQIVGYTDTAGSDKYNMQLSLRRAQAVKKALMAAGVPGDKLTVEGRGKADPLVPTADGVREPQNRRVAVRFPH